VVADGITSLIGGLRGIAADDAPLLPVAGHGDGKPVWVFSGQGSQWPGMGVDLLAREPVFAATVAQLEPLIAHESGFSVTEAMTTPEALVRIDHIQPVLFAMQVALAATMRSYGVHPGAVIGHSLGETAAAVVVGALSLEDAVRVICRRSLLCARLAGGGAMASVELPVEQVREELRAQNITDVVVAVIASPQSTVVGGPPAAVRELVAAWERREVMAREVNVDVASHTPQLDPILPDLAAALTNLTPMPSKVRFYSATLDDPRAQPSWDSDYWVANLSRPVQFAMAVQAAIDDGFRVFGEISPHPLLVRAVDQIAVANDIQVQAVPCMRRQQELPHGMRDFLANVHCAGGTVDFSVLYPSGRLVDAPLPTWTHQQQLMIGATGSGHKAQGAATIAVHPLLGAHVRLPEEPERHAWQGRGGIAELPWLADHRVNNVAAYPGAAYCEMALAVAHTVFGAPSEVRDLEFEQLLLPDEHTEVAVGASVEAPGVAEFVVVTHQEDEQIRRAVAVVHATAEHELGPSHDLAGLLAAHPNRVEGADIRKWFAGRKIQYGPAFSGLTAVHTAVGSGSTLVAEVSLPSDIRAQQGAYGVHPALLDACFQSVVACMGSEQDEGGLLLPLSVRRLRRYGVSRGARYCYVRVVKDDASAIEADLSLLDEQGVVWLEVLGLKMGAGATNADRDRLLSERLVTIEWQQHDLSDKQTADPGVWLLIAAPEDESRQRVLEIALTSRGAECRTLRWPTEGVDATYGQMLESTLSVGGIKGVVMLAAPPAGRPEEHGVVAEPRNVRRLVKIARRVAEVPVETPRLFVVTQCAQAVGSEDPINLEQGALRGLVRVIGAEYPQLHPTHIDLDAETDPALIAAELISGERDDETAWREGLRYCARMRSTPFRSDERRTVTVDFERDGARLEIRTPGELETLELAAIERRTPGRGEIEVAVAASSINFADVLVAFGRYPSFDGRAPQLGVDFAGVVAAVGDGVTEHKVGDIVGGFGAQGCWGTFVTCDARLAVALPPGLTPEQAAAVSTTYATAWLGLVDLARIQAGDRVLIHSATGGVGQAAIAIARHAGAQIFATAGSPQRRALLHEMGVEHVYDSRTTEFADLIRHDTDGYGVDIVLNSLTGAAQRAGLELLSFGGRFVEIGKQDIYGNTRLGLYPFRRNLSFYCVDLTLLATSHPERIRQLMRTVYGLVADEVLPVGEHTEYPLGKATTAIRTMSAAEHTGKLVLSVPRIGHSNVVVPPARARTFRRDGAYIITGGLGGLGLFLADRMAAAGCGRIVLTSRSEPGPRAQEAIARMRASGADVHVECGDIAEPETAEHLVALATAAGLPLRGVVHAAGVVFDATLGSITDELIDRDWGAKVSGAWHLHHATAGQPLDWFCSFSSAAAMLGSPGQGAYAAANSWLDGFTYWRRNQGFPATAIAWGAWADIGRGAVLAQRGDTTMVKPDDGGYAFEQVLRHDRAHTGYFPTTGAPWLAALASHSPIAEAFLTPDGDTSSGTQTLLAELRSLPSDQWLDRVRRLVADQMSLVLRQTIDPDRPFADHGLDSLGNLELRTHIETETGIRVSPKAMLTHNTVRALAQHLTDVLSAEVTS
jgi:acyl transferase domain-containing protein/acyl carrier protein